MAVNFGIQAHDYAEPRRGGTILAPGFNPGLKRKTKTRFGVIFDGEAENHDKT